MINVKRSIEISLRYAQDCENAKRLSGLTDLIKGILAGKKGYEKIALKVMGIFDFFRYYERLAVLNEIRNPLHPDIASCYWKGVPRLFGIVHNGPVHHNWTTLLPLLGVTSMAETKPLPLEAVKPEMVDDCFVQAAEIISVEGDKLVAAYRPVIKTGEGLALGPVTNKLVERGFISDPWPGQLITLHFGSAIEPLDKNEFNNLLSITEQALELYNNTRRA